MAKGLCRSCYMVQWNRKWRETEKGRVLTNLWAANYRTKNPTKFKSSKAAYRQSYKGLAADLKRFNMTPEDFYKLLLKQDGVCAICFSPPKEGSRLHVDHNHITNAVRGLLCNLCNHGLGNFKDNKELLLRAIEYLGID